MVKREKRLLRETGGSFAVDNQVWVRSTCSRPGLLSEGPGQPGGTVNNDLMKFDKEKCEVLLLGRENHWQQHRLGVDWLCCRAALL